MKILALKYDNPHCDHLSIPENLDLVAIAKEHKHWLLNVYAPAYKAGVGVRYKDLADWLIDHHGAKEVTKAELEVFNVRE